VKLFGFTALICRFVIQRCPGLTDGDAAEWTIAGPPRLLRKASRVGRTQPFDRSTAPAPLKAGQAQADGLRCGRSGVL
jgi:hypothetical protein